MRRQFTVGVILLISSALTISVSACTTEPEAATASATANTAASAATTTRVQNILLTDDDGWDAAGITTMYRALRAAGFSVTLVAPRRNHSGASMSTTDGDLKIRHVRPGPVWWVGGTPVDALRVGLTAIVSEQPDLVVSGINHGANAAYNVNYSGTVGAATAAAEAGVPAIAVSADVGATESTVDYAAAARTVVHLARSLPAAALQDMSAGTLVNVNVPYRSGTREAPRGIRVAAQADAEWTDITYERSSSGAAVPSYALHSHALAGTDSHDLAAGFTTLTVLSAGRDGTPIAHSHLDTALRALETK